MKLFKVTYSTGVMNAVVWVVAKDQCAAVDAIRQKCLEWGYAFNYAATVEQVAQNGKYGVPGVLILTQELHEDQTGQSEIKP